MSALVASTTLGGRPALEAAPATPEPARYRDLMKEVLPVRQQDFWPSPLEATLQAIEAELRSGETAHLAPGTVEAADPATGQQDPPVLRFDIPPGLLGPALVTFRSITGYAVTLAEEGISTLPTPGVSGLHTPEQALEALLSGTGVGFRVTAPGNVLLEVRLASETIDVTAEAPAEPISPKYTRPLREVPQTITVVPQSVIAEQSATTLRDVLRNVSGISIQAGEGGVPAGDNLSIRGFSARTDIFVDGVRDFGGYSRDTFNVEQVEVVKGPASSYAGRGSTGGSVNLATKAPHAGTEHHATIGAGSAAFRRGTVDLNQPIESEALGGAAVRLNAMWSDGDTPGRDTVEGTRWGAAPTLTLGLESATRVTLGYMHLDQDNVPDYGVPWVPANNVPLAEFANQPAPVDFSNFYGLRDRDYENIVTGMATATVEHDVSSTLRVRNLFRYGQTDRDSVITAPRFASTESTDIRRTDWKPRDQTDEVVANQTDLTAAFRTGGLTHSLVTGLELSREQEENFTRIETGPETPVTDLFDPNPFDPYNGAIVRNGEFASATARTTAVYAFDTVAVSEQVDLSGGLRWDHFDVDYRNADGEPFQRTDREVSWRAGAVYKPHPTGSVYAGYGTSFNPSAEGLSLATRGGSLEGVEPEKSRSVEVGTKWDLFGGRFAVSAAAFRTEKTNARTSGLNPSDPPIVLDGEQRVHGFEVALSGPITASWSAFGGYTYMQSRITESNESDEIGRAFGNTPEHSLNLWTTYALPWNVEIGGGTQYVGDRFNSSSGARTAPGYWLVDAMAAYRVSDQLTLRLNIYNLADEQYIDRVGGGHFIPGPGRSAALTSTIGF